MSLSDDGRRSTCLIGVHEIARVFRVPPALVSAAADPRNGIRASGCPAPVLDPYDGGATADPLPVKRDYRAWITPNDLGRWAAWSQDTFGPGERTAAVLDHLRRELAEVEADPSDPEEWADVLLLAFDGASRAGITPLALFAAVHAKHDRNVVRMWPDWRTADHRTATEHLRDPGSDRG